MAQQQLKTISLQQINEMLSDNHNKDIQFFINSKIGIAQRMISKLAIKLINQPFQFPEMRIIIIKKGVVKPIINLLPHYAKEGDLIFAANNSNAIIQHASKDLEIEGILIYPELLYSIFNNDIPHVFDGHIRDFQIHLTHEDKSYIESIITLLYN